MSPNQRPGAGTVISVLVVSFLAAGVVQFAHEATHAVATLLVGARLEQFHLWAVDTQWANDKPFWAEIGVVGSAAVVNILCWCLCAALLGRLKDKPALRLFVFYVGAYSLFIGFGYLLIDPLFANADSLGDWARVVMMLGGGWPVRVLISGIGCAGTVYGYYWMGDQAMRFSTSVSMDRPARNQLGFVLFILPYIANNAVFSILAIWHPVGVGGTVAVLMQYWLGYCGFFWAYMIKFIWSEHSGPSDDETRLGARVGRCLWILGGIQIALIACLLRGFQLGWSL